MSRRALPWQRPRHERLVLALVAAAALLPVQPVNSQDISRFSLSEAVARAGTLVTGGFGGATTADHSAYRGRIYSDKAPGLSVLAIPAVEATRLPRAQRWHAEGDWRLWIVRLSTNGAAFLALLFAFGRIAEGLFPGTGSAATVALGLGTMLTGLASSGFDHVATAAALFGAFALAWRGGRGQLLAGLLAGAALLLEYQAALAGVVLGTYVAYTGGRRAFAWFAAGAAPGVLLLGAYDWAAFGSPFHLSYRYVSSTFAPEQARGFFGIGRPHLHSLWLVLGDGKGLLVASPVVVLAAWGLWLLWRRGLRAEAGVCAALSVAFALVAIGFYLPYGGSSPGPRYAAPMLPFLLLGAGAAFARLPRVTAVATAASAAASLAIAYTWQVAARAPLHGSIWGELGRLVMRGTKAPLYADLAKTAPVLAGLRRDGGAALGCLAAAAALVAAFWPLLTGAERKLKR